MKKMGWPRYCTSGPNAYKRKLSWICWFMFLTSLHKHWELFYRFDPFDKFFIVLRWNKIFTSFSWKGMEHSQLFELSFFCLISQPVFYWWEIWISSPVGSNEPGLHLRVSEVVGLLVRKSCDVSYVSSTNELTFLVLRLDVFLILSAENSRTILVHIIRVFIDQLTHHTTEKPTSKRE